MFDTIESSRVGDRRREQFLGFVPERVSTRSGRYLGLVPQRRPVRATLQIAPCVPRAFLAEVSKQCFQSLQSCGTPISRQEPPLQEPLRRRFPDRMLERLDAGKQLTDRKSTRLN